MKQYYFTVFTALYLLYCIFLSFYLLSKNHRKMKITTIPMEV